MSNDPSRYGVKTLVIVALVGLFAAFGVRMYWLAPDPIPSILAGLPQSKTEADQQGFQERLRKLYVTSGVGYEADLYDLQDEGFVIDAGNRTATYNRAPGVSDKCRYSANIRWQARSDSAIADITGGYLYRCPEH